MTTWWQAFFDEEYLAVWSGVHPAEASEAEAEVLWELLELREGDSVLDAPCGYGRISAPLVERGARVVGVDASATLLDAARRACDERELADRARFIHADMREPFAAGECVAAINLFSSVGYGSDEDDRAIFTNIAAALGDRGRLFVDTMHRDVVVARRAREARPGIRLADGTEIREEQQFDPVSGRVATTWRWSGPRGEGEKSADLRIYTVTELVALLADCGFELLATHAGVSLEPFDPSAGDAGGRLGLLLEKR